MVAPLSSTCHWRYRLLTLHSPIQSYTHQFWSVSSCVPCQAEWAFVEGETALACWFSRHITQKSILPSHQFSTTFHSVTKAPTPSRVLWHTLQVTSLMSANEGMCQHRGHFTEVLHLPQLLLKYSSVHTIWEATTMCLWLLHKWVEQQLLHLRSKLHVMEYLLILLSLPLHKF